MWLSFDNAPLEGYVTNRKFSLCLLLFQCFKKNAFYSLNIGPDVGQNVKILRKFISFFISDSIWWMKTLSGKFSDNQPIESRLLQM